ncbi:hypothetical protein KJ877_01610 [bacterium]|nr:hypothetical protein [bacterium]MBU1989960.1 hypothetical protein [bacterium]
MSNAKKGLFFGVIFAFFVMGFVAMQRALPASKEAGIYSELKAYIPYTLEKKVGGLAIIDKRTGRKETPSAAEVMLRLDELEQQWGKDHLQVVDNHLIVLNDLNQSIVKIFIKTQEERLFLKQFFGI